MGDVGKGDQGIRQRVRQCPVIHAAEGAALDRNEIKHLASGHILGLKLLDHAQSVENLEASRLEHLRFIE